MSALELDAYVLLNPNPRANPAALAADIAATFPSEPAVRTSNNPTTGAPNFHFGRVAVSTCILPIPMPANELDPVYPSSWLWPSAKEELRTHSAMLTLKAEGADTAAELMAPLTMVAAAVIGTCPQAVGVFWSAGKHLVRGNVFRAFAARQLPKKLPLLLWLGTPAEASGNGTSSGHTEGLSWFDLPEIEATDALMSVPDLRQRLNDVAEYLTTKGDIADGATIGESATQKVTVSYGPSRRGLKGRVMRLHHHRKG
jgi:hypothetical protein